MHSKCFAEDKLLFKYIYRIQNINGHRHTKIVDGCRFMGVAK